MGAPNFSRSNEVAAAWINVEPVLATKRRGDDVSRAEVQLAAGTCDARRLDAKIRRYFLRQGIDPIPIVNVGWHLPTDEEQARNRTDHHKRRAYRETRRELLAASATDENALTPEARRLKARLSWYRRDVADKYADWKRAVGPW